jgi:IS4 transposase
MDLGYTDYALFGRWTEKKVWFVTRMKVNAVYTVECAQSAPENRAILRDEIVLLAGVRAFAKCPYPLRRIVVWDPEKEQEIVLLTNHLFFGATTIAAIYKDRWQIELFFKALKQNLKVKTFVGTTENALRIQIWTALTAILLVKLLQFRSKLGWSLSNLVALLHWNLFTYRDLWEWLDDPFHTPPLEPGPLQLALFAAPVGQHPA